MFTIATTMENDFAYLDLKNGKESAKAKISLHEGGRLMELQFNGIYIIKDEPSSKYKDTFASSILFPFANRIKNGLYSFNGKEYKLNCNENGRNNALHGLVFDKKFEIIDRDLKYNSCAITLLYQEKEKSIGFPFLYNIYITYTLKDNNINVSVKIKNTDKNSFPFTLGWHPYFLSNDLYNSSLNFKSNEKIQFDKNLITSGFTNYNQEMPLQIKDNQLDDSYILKTNLIEFTTPLYHIKLDTNTAENFLQTYTPENRNTIAIEPMTGICDSFNNKKGLQTLHSNDEFTTQWNVTFYKKNNTK